MIETESPVTRVQTATGVTFPMRVLECRDAIAQAHSNVQALANGHGRARA
jgi:hypothetical protein